MAVKMLAISIELLSSISTDLEALCHLLIDCVDVDASIGFLPPLSMADAQSYWQGIDAELKSGSRKLLITRKNQQIVACVQLSLVGKANGLHRAEVEKLMVAKSTRGQGIAKQLMLALEALAAENQRSLLVLDTRQGDNASHLYRKLAYQEAGVIPDFALNAAGELEATVYFYKQLNIQ